MQGIIFFGSGLAFLMALQQLSVRNPDRLNVLGFSLLSLNAVILANVGMALTRMQESFPGAAIFFVSAIFGVGPLNLFYYRLLMEPRRAIPYKTWLHIAPAIAAVIPGVVLFAKGDPYRAQAIRSLLDDPLASPYGLLIGMGAIHVFGYLTYLFAVEYSLWKSSELRSEIRLLVLLNLAAEVTVVLLASGFFLKRGGLIALGGVLMSVIHMVIFLASHRYPHFFQRIRQEIKKKRYERSLLAGVDIEKVYRRLMELMEEEELYRDMELNLKTVSDLLGLTPHQLSQFMNERLNQDFRTFVNTFRVADAKRRLVEHPDKGILEICFEAGFNSKSTFNAVFKKFTGQTPKEYRFANARGE